MQHLTISEAAVKLPELIKAATRGEEIIIAGEDNETGQLIALQPVRQPRKAGSGKGTFFMADDFDAPLEDFKEYME
jgi:antitoxin (DNA-binding transcriptional repressor) of toxin-antitoxin stability system